MISAFEVSENALVLRLLDSFLKYGQCLHVPEPKSGKMQSPRLW